MSFDYGLYPCVHSQLDDDEEVQPLYVLIAPPDPNSDEAFKVSVTDGLSLWHGVVTKDYLNDMIEGYENISTDRSTAREFVLSVLQGADTEGKREFDSTSHPYHLIWSVTAGCMQLKIGTVELTDEDVTRSCSGSALSRRIALLAQHVAQLREHEAHMVAEHTGLKADRVTFGATLARFKTEADEHQEKMLGAMCIKLNEHKKNFREDQASSSDGDGDINNDEGDERMGVDSDDESSPTNTTDTTNTSGVASSSSTQSSSVTQPYSPSAKADNNTHEGSDSDEYL